MRWKSGMIAMAAAVCLSAPALRPQNAAVQTKKGTATTTAANDTFLLIDGVRQSYDGWHHAAREELQAYMKIHPYDLLAPDRLLYDYIFATHGPKMGKKEYEDVLHIADNAIKVFEARGCSGTDLSIAGKSVDCAYVGAALYASREALLVKNNGIFHALGAIRRDDRRALHWARRSNFQQARLLIGINEYEKSKVLFNRRAEALDEIVAATNDKTSLFAADPWFFIYYEEIHHGASWDWFDARYPHQEIKKWLERKYPHNGIFHNPDGAYFEAH